MDAGSSPRIFTNASHPFDNTTADTILRSSDGTDFRVHSVILVEASPFFKELFSLPQPPRNKNIEDPSEDYLDGRAVVTMAENRITLDGLLRLCYPIAEPVIDELKDIEVVLEAAMKYDMEQATARLTRMLRTLADTQPLRVWAVACRLRIEPEAWSAAQKTLSKEILHDFPLEMRGISAGAYYRLLQFHRLEGNVDADFVFCYPPKKVQLDAEGDTTNRDPIRHDFFAHPFADIICRSSDGVDLQVHKIILSMASPVLRSRIPDVSSSDAAPKGGEPSTISQEGHPVLDLAENSQTLAVLLKLCYPVDEEGILSENLASLWAVAQAAKNYEMKRVTNIIGKTWDRIARKDPLRAYLLVAEAKLTDYAKQAARQSLRRGNLEEEYIPEMENASAAVYYQLLKYREACRKRVLKENGELHAEEWWEGAERIEESPDADKRKDCTCGKHEKANATRRKCMECARKWMHARVDDGLQSISEDPDGGEMCEVARSVLKESVEQGCWCSDCEQMAKFFTRFDTYIHQKLKEVVSEVELDIEDV